MGGGGWVAGSSETKANLAQLGLEIGLSLATICKFHIHCFPFSTFIYLNLIIKTELKQFCLFCILRQ